MKNIFLIPALFILLICFIVSCEEKKQKSKNICDLTKEEIPMNARFLINYCNDSIRQAKLENALEYGDTASYMSVSSDYAFSIIGKDEFLYYALKMSDKYNYSGAEYDVFSYYHLLESKSNMIKKTRDYYLIKSFLKGNESATFEVKRLFGSGEDYILDTARLKKYYNELEENLEKKLIHY